MEQFIAPKKNNTIVKKYPTFRDTFVNGSWKWIEGKRRDDNASGSFWRIHNKLYDLNEFIDQHPGGKFWIETTKVNLIILNYFQKFFKFAKKKSNFKFFHHIFNKITSKYFSNSFS